MLFKHLSSKSRYTEYVRRRKDPAWSKMEKTEARAAELAAAGRATLESVAKEVAKAKAAAARARTFSELFREFWKHLAGHRPTLFLALTTLTCSTFVGLVMPASTKVTIDYILTDHPGPTGLPAWVGATLGIGPEFSVSDRKHLLWALAVLMIGVTLFSVTIGSWGRWQMTRLTKRLQSAMRRRAFDHAVQLPLHKLYQFKSGGVVSILREDAGGAAELLFSMIYNPWRAIVQLAGTLIILTVVDWRMLLGAAAIIPATWLTHRTWINRIRPVYRDIRITRQGMDGHTTETFGGMRVVRGFGRQHGESSRYTHAQNYMVRQEILVWWESRLLEIIWAVLIPFASVAVLVYGGSRVIDRSLSIGDVMMFSTYLLMLLSPLETLTSTAANIQSNLAGFDRILDVLAEPREFSENRGTIPVSREVAQGRISIRHVSFTYPMAIKPKSRKKAEVKDASRPGAHSMNGSAGLGAPEPDPEPIEVLHDIDLEVKAGETIALIGPSGSGKTTLCNLIARFYDPTRGSIALDGVDLKQIDLDGYRRLLGIVEQDVFLFDGSVAENIGYGRRDATMEQIRAAAAAANADGFIEKLEYRYETVIGERGVRLSGGQKQRIAIARAILADPLILILDEATSNLDSESEALIQKSLAVLMRGRTSFVIAHRLSTIRHASRIVVMENGKVIEVGSHEQLIERSGRYAELLRLQVEGSQAALHPSAHLGAPKAG